MLARDPVAPAPTRRNAGSSVIVVDAVGGIFERLRDAELPVALWRVLDARRVTPDVSGAAVVCATSGPVLWDELGDAAARARTVIVTTAYRRDEADEALRRGLAGYVDATLPPAAFERTLRGALLQGEPAFSREVIGGWMREERTRRRSAADSLEALSARQRQILTLVAQGATDKEIAATLGIALATAQKHVANILSRLKVPNRTAAVAAMARRTGPEPDPPAAIRRLHARGRTAPIQDVRAIPRAS